MTHPDPVNFLAVSHTDKRIIAAAEVVLIFPATLFLSAVLLRNLALTQSDLTHAAQMIVTWYSDRYWTLLILLICLPLAAFLAGCFTLLQIWNEDKELQPASKPFIVSSFHFATFIITGATSGAGLILAVVALHMLAN
jgi:hypothetical protein